MGSFILLLEGRGRERERQWILPRRDDISVRNSRISEGSPSEKEMGICYGDFYFQKYRGLDSVKSFWQKKKKKKKKEEEEEKKKKGEEKWEMLDKR